MTINQPLAQAVVAAGSRGSLAIGSPMDEEALIRAAQAGDHDAFERLVRQYDRGVLRIAMNVLRSEDDAHDIYQEAFLRVYRNLGDVPFRLQLPNLAVSYRQQPVRRFPAAQKGSADQAGHDRKRRRNGQPARLGPRL